MKTFLKKLTVVALSTFALTAQIFANDNESATEKVKEGASDGKKNAKKKYRKAKKKIRDATGNNSPVEDVKDAGRNLDDEVKDKTDDLKK